MRPGSSIFRDGNLNCVPLQRLRNPLVSIFHIHIFNYLHIMYCTYCQFIHNFVNFYGKAIFMGDLSSGELSVGELSADELSVVRIVPQPYLLYPSTMGKGSGGGRGTFRNKGLPLPSPFGLLLIKKIHGNDT